MQMIHYTCKLDTSFLNDPLTGEKCMYNMERNRLSTLDTTSLLRGEDKLLKLLV